MLNKKGDWMSPQSWWYFLGGLLFLVVGLMPFFDFLSINLTFEGVLLRVLIVVLGFLILIEGFTAMLGKAGKVLLSLIFMAFGLLLLLMYFGVSWIPFNFNLSDIALQIILIIYAGYLFIGAWRQ
ncbi:hypothetical protein J4438_02930 [Candidatus Woesearchaeota archaeon]|nr:hypothetical protein [Candidatus Woesearchaeota archaeon]